MGWHGMEHIRDRIRQYDSHLSIRQGDRSERRRNGGRGTIRPRRRSAESEQRRALGWTDMERDGQWLSFDRFSGGRRAHNLQVSRRLDNRWTVSAITSYCGSHSMGWESVVVVRELRF